MADLNINPLTTEQQLLGTSPETSELSRQRRIAELLMAKGVQQPQGEMVSGHYVKPSFAQQIAPMLNAAMGVGLDKSLDDKQYKMAQALRGEIAENQATFQRGMADPTTRQATMQWAAGKRGLEDTMKEFMKPQKVGKDETITMLGAGGEPIILAEGKVGTPESIQAAQILKGLPADHRKWNDQQRAVAEQAVVALKKAGASNVSVDLGKAFAKNAPDKILAMMGDTKNLAQSALNTADSANNIIKAIDSNDIYTGPGANIKIGAAQLADMAGLGGETTKQKLANSRQAIQGLAELTLQGRLAMKGQGAITQSEGELAEKARAGKIDLTAGEIRILANAAKRVARFNYENHQSMVGQLQGIDKEIAGFYNVGANPKIFDTGAVSGANIGEAGTPKSQGQDPYANARSIVRGGTNP